MKNAFTVDYEDWYHSMGLPQDQWSSYEDRIKIGHDKILALLSKHGAKATFFVIGDLIDKHPELIQEILDEGHEIGCHTYTHRSLHDLGPEGFDTELKKCKTALEKITSRKFIGFRAPMWSVDADSLWALDVLHENEYVYDTSIYPGDNKRTGIVGYPKQMHRLDSGMVEVPCCTFPFLKYEVGVGGAYFRILPYQITKRSLRQINKSGRPGMFYVHPWELDPGHPRVKNISRRMKFPHYFNLASTERRIDKLLSDFEFTNLNEIVQEQMQS